MAAPLGGGDEVLRPLEPGPAIFLRIHGRHGGGKLRRMARNIAFQFLDSLPSDATDLQPSAHFRASAVQQPAPEAQVCVDSPPSAEDVARRNFPSRLAAMSKA